MFYKKPSNVTYTQMAIYIDNTIYKENITDEEKNTVFEYLYHLAKMLAVKGRFFNKSYYYEDFSIYIASEIFMRLTNPKQFEKNSPGRKLSKIKSVLNYMKGILPYRKLIFEEENYSQSISQEDLVNVEQKEYTFQSMINDSIDNLNLVEFDSCLMDVCKTIKNFLSRNTPYKNDKLFLQNIYISCLLSFLNSISLSRFDINRINSIKTPKILDDYINACFEKESKDFVIMYHLPDDMKDYMHVLTKEIKHSIAKDISLEYNSVITSNTGLQALTLHELNI